MIAFICLICLITSYVFYWNFENTFIEVENFEILSERIPQSFNGYKIVQVSDLHNTLHGENQKNLVSKIKDNKPDIIVITGDLIDNLQTYSNSILFVNEAVKIAPVYFIRGNHEAYGNGDYEELKTKLKKCGVTVLDDEAVVIRHGKGEISLIGIIDPEINGEYMAESETIAEMRIDNTVNSNDNNYKILLSHRTELINLYAKKNIDLVFSGHAHGGQIRIPFFGGIYAPNQGWFPKYTSGLYEKGSTKMIVSRGLGNAGLAKTLVPRINNNMNINVVTLKTK